MECIEGWITKRTATRSWFNFLQRRLGTENTYTPVRRHPWGCNLHPLLVKQCGIPRCLLAFQASGRDIGCPHTIRLGGQSRELCFRSVLPGLSENCLSSCDFPSTVISRISKRANLEQMTHYHVITLRYCLHRFLSQIHVRSMVYLYTMLRDLF